MPAYGPRPRNDRKELNSPPLLAIQQFIFTSMLGSLRDNAAHKGRRPCAKLRPTNITPSVSLLQFYVILLFISLILELRLPAVCILYDFLNFFTKFHPSFPAIYPGWNIMPPTRVAYNSSSLINNTKLCRL